MDKSGFRRTKAAISLKRVKIRPRLLLRTNTKSHTRFRIGRHVTYQVYDLVDGHLWQFIQQARSMTLCSLTVIVNGAADRRELTVFAIVFSLSQKKRFILLMH